MRNLKVMADPARPGRSEAQLSEEEYYLELTRRNRAFIAPETQGRLANLKVLIAGCGSTGGACIEPLARLGVTRFALADNGSYELNNLNRQHAFFDSIGRNKAQFHAEELKRINPWIDVVTETRGIESSNVERLVHWADLVIDAIDVTSLQGIEAKLLLHEVASLQQKPVLSALDMGFCQWGRSYDYRKPGMKPLSDAFGGSLPANPVKALFQIVPLSAVPTHCLPLVRDLLKDGALPASQLGCASDLLSAVIAPVVIRFVESGEIVSGWNVSLEHLAKPLLQRLRFQFKRFQLLAEIRLLISRAS